MAPFNANADGSYWLQCYGSVARGDARPYSDVDVWVRLDPLFPDVLVHLKQELEKLLSTSVEVVRLRERMNPSLKQRIRHEGHRPWWKADPSQLDTELGLGSERRSISAWAHCGSACLQVRTAAGSAGGSCTTACEHLPPPESGARLAGLSQSRARHPEDARQKPSAAVSRVWSSRHPWSGP